MKKPLLYLFILSVLLNIFTYMYFSKKVAFEEERIANFQKETRAKKDSIATLYNSIAEADYFSLHANENAIDYLSAYDTEQLAMQLRDEILSLNTIPTGNPLTKYEQINGKNALINKIKILNHRWIIADFSAGNAWGEVLIKYFVEEGKPTDFTTIDAIVYPNTIK